MQVHRIQLETNFFNGSEIFSSYLLFKGLKTPKLIVNMHQGYCYGLF